MSLRGHRIRSSDQVPTERFLMVTLDSRQFALSAELVQGLLTIEESDAVGTLTVQGQEYPSLDLASRLGIAQGGDGPETRTVLLAQAGIRACIRVDQVHGLVEVERARVLALPRHFCSDERNWYVGLILYGDGLALGLNSVWLMQGAIQASCGLNNPGQRLSHCESAISDRRGTRLIC